MSNDTFVANFTIGLVLSFWATFFLAGLLLRYAYKKGHADGMEAARRLYMQLRLEELKESLSNDNIKMSCLAGSIEELTNKVIELKKKVDDINETNRDN